MLFRFWDLAYPERSYIVAGGANDSLHCPSVLYSRKIIEGTEVVQVGSHEQVHTPHRCSRCDQESTRVLFPIMPLRARARLETVVSLQEIHSKQKSGVVEDSPRRGPESLPVGHHDIITDIATFQTTQGFIVTSSRDGIVKVWK